MPQIIINYTFLLEENKYIEDASKVYEGGVKIVKYPHVKDIWELFEHAVETAPANAVKHLYLQYAKLEEDYGLAKQAMKVYDQATKVVLNVEKLCIAIESGLPDKDVKTMLLGKSLGEIDSAREIYIHASMLIYGIKNESLRCNIEMKMSLEQRC
ncbi:hypothetical protein QQP08_013690 [Theobroma cacao]|nr:hypothetical protein QQP08_013690 [Theobroma cacao]